MDCTRTALLAAALASSSTAALAAGTSSSGADKVVPPPLSRPLKKYYQAHPADFQNLLQRLPHAKTFGPQASAAAPATATAGTWRPVLTNAPESGLSNPLLMTDGSVIVHILESTHWYKLTPNLGGNYAKGTWTQIASLPNNYSPLYFGSQVLVDGNVIMNGGEYDLSVDSSGGQADSNHGALYNFLSNTWTAVAPPLNWANIGDSSSIMLANGTYMLADCCSTAEALLSYPAMTWTTTGSGKYDINDEEGWAKLTDGTVITTDAYVEKGTCGNGTERYSQVTGAWTSAGNATAQMSDCSGNSTGNGPSYEVGPVLETPSFDNVAIAFSGVATGAAAGTSFFDPITGKWNAGVNVPAVSGKNYTLADAPAVVLPNGNILFAASPGLFTNPVHHFELSFNSGVYQYDLSNNGTIQPENITQVGDTPNSPNITSYQENMLVLPTGEVLSTDFSNTAYIYTPSSSTPVSGIAPVISSVPTGLTRGQDYLLQGSQLNGRSHGNYGDDVQSDTNFPLVLIVNNATNDHFYARTHNFTTRSIAPGKNANANFTVNSSTETGASTLYVIANGVSSTGVAVTIY